MSNTRGAERCTFDVAPAEHTDRRSDLHVPSDHDTRGHDYRVGRLEHRP